MKTTTHMASTNRRTGTRRTAHGQRGYALLGLLLALSVISLFLVSSVVPNVKMQVQRSKETELIYRGNQMARAIARYYGGRVLRPLQLQVPPPYGYLTELKKLRDGVTLGVQEIRFARASELIDPMTGVEWEPVRARDPRINAVLQAYSAETGAIIPLSYLLLAGPPAKTHKINPGGSTGETKPAQSENKTGQPSGEGVVVKPPTKEATDPDDDDDDDDDLNDPLSHLFESSSNSTLGKSNVPIVGVAPKLKGKAIRPLYGLENYEEWVFIFIPESLQGNVPGQQQQPPPSGPLKTSP
jgi:type II secretory pathway pseudopilin PulG